jgi:hypothetical protein
MKDIEFYIYKGKDALNTPHLTIKINDEEVFIPTKIITDFIQGDGKNIKIIIPN